MQDASKTTGGHPALMYIYIYINEMALAFRVPGIFAVSGWWVIITKPRGCFFFCSELRLLGLDDWA